MTSGNREKCLNDISSKFFSQHNKLRFQNVVGPHEHAELVFSNPPSLKSVSEKLRFRNGLVWTVGLTVEIKLRFKLPPA